MRLEVSLARDDVARRLDDELLGKNAPGIEVERLYGGRRQGVYDFGVPARPMSPWNCRARVRLAEDGGVTRLQVQFRHGGSFGAVVCAALGAATAYVLSPGPRELPAMPMLLGLGLAALGLPLLIGDRRDRRRIAGRLRELFPERRPAV